MRTMLGRSSLISTPLVPVGRTAHTERDHLAASTQTRFQTAPQSLSVAASTATLFRRQRQGRPFHLDIRSPPLKNGRLIERGHRRIESQLNPTKSMQTRLRKTTSILAGPRLGNVQKDKPLSCCPMAQMLIRPLMPFQRQTVLQKRAIGATWRLRWRKSTPCRCLYLTMKSAVPAVAGRKTTR